MRKNFVNNLLAVMGLALLSICSAEVQAKDWVTFGLYRPSTNTFYLRNSNTYGDPDLVIPFGAPGDLPLAGDWDGNGTTTIGVYRPSSGQVFVRNSNTWGNPDITDNSLTLGILFDGGPDYFPVAGDWDGDGTTTPGLYNNSNTTFFAHLSFNQGSPGAPHIQFFGAPGDLPVVGNWDGLGS